MSKERHVNEIMSDMISNWPTPKEITESRIAARNKHMPEICLILGIEFVKMDIE